jgi:hypothetical protein
MIWKLVCYKSEGLGIALKDTYCVEFPNHMLLL